MIKKTKNAFVIFGVNNGSYIKLYLIFLILLIIFKKMEIQIFLFNQIIKVCYNVFISNIEKNKHYSYI